MDQINRWLLSLGISEGTALLVSQVLLIISILAATSLLQYLTDLFVRRSLRHWL